MKTSGPNVEELPTELVTKIILEIDFRSPSVSLASPSQIQHLSVQAVFRMVRILMVRQLGSRIDRCRPMHA